jgi:hypothetical protein
MDLDLAIFLFLQGDLSGGLGHAFFLAVRPCPLGQEIFQAGLAVVDFHASGLGDDELEQGVAGGFSFLFLGPGVDVGLRLRRVGIAPLGCGEA